MTETDLHNSILAALSPYARVFRTNAGDFWQGNTSKLNGEIILKNLRKVKGLPKGYSDISGVRISDGRAIFIEAKLPGNVPSGEQENFLKVMSECGAITGVAYSVEDALRIVGAS